MLFDVRQRVSRFAFKDQRHVHLQEFSEGQQLFAGDSTHATKDFTHLRFTPDDGHEVGGAEFHVRHSRPQEIDQGRHPDGPFFLLIDFQLFCDFLEFRHFLIVAVEALDRAKMPNKAWERNRQCAVCQSFHFVSAFDLYSAWRLQPVPPLGR